MGHQGQGNLALILWVSVLGTVITLHETLSVPARVITLHESSQCKTRVKTRAEVYVQLRLKLI